MAKQKGMSFIEKAGLFFGVVGVMADFVALVSFNYGFASLQQFTPSHISSGSATSFFRLFSGLMIIYAWLITSWYLTRRTFILRYEKPRAYKNPLTSRSIRTIFGVGLFLVPTFTFWSIVNISFSVPVSRVNPAPTSQITETFIPTFETPQSEIESTTTPNINFTETVLETPTLDTTTISSLETTSSAENSTPSSTETALPITPARTSTPEDVAVQMSATLAFTYYVFFFPLGIGFFGLVIFASLNSLMPIVHVELLDDYE